MVAASAQRVGSAQNRAAARVRAEFERPFSAACCVHAPLPWVQRLPAEPPRPLLLEQHQRGRRAVEQRLPPRPAGRLGLRRVRPRRPPRRAAGARAGRAPGLLHGRLRDGHRARPRGPCAGGVGGLGALDDRGGVRAELPHDGRGGGPGLHVRPAAAQGLGGREQGGAGEGGRLLLAAPAADPPAGARHEEADIRSRQRRRRNGAVFRARAVDGFPRAVPPEVCRGELGVVRLLPWKRPPPRNSQ
mmetsp:Transcript_27138/g.72588  ORF Transcript_27138/g.72588 Transcript_27138/m.72588 type:complete len:245 (-) Transcript_27138:627-1361(-)